MWKSDLSDFGLYIAQAFIVQGLFAGLWVVHHEANQAVSL
jgi:hypothetical protein